MVVREGFFGNRRYDRILTELEIAPNILTDRLSRLVANGVFNRRQYQSSPDRYEYLLSTWDATSTAPLSRCSDGATAGFQRESLLSCQASRLRTRFHASVVCDRCKQARSSPPTCATG